MITNKVTMKMISAFKTTIPSEIDHALNCRASNYCFNKLHY